ncbi:MAG: HEAT repeat domain-containing protein [Nostoc sp.]|uniref:HEAT repeat domain-containing protein n=1 Tax=Nostoc sp. TaxID=1180 RepID=UPI002FF927F9
MHDWQYFFNHDRSNLNQGTYRIFEPEWKAKILHWFSQKDVDKEQKEDFIQALIDFDDSCGDFYRYRAYFLAAEALSQFPECSLGDVITSQVLKWSYAYFRQDKRDWQILPKPLVKTARKTLELTDRKRVIAAFVHLVHTTESLLILRVAAEKLGKLDPGNKSAITALALMSITELINRPATYLLEIEPGNKAAIATLSKTLETSQSDFERLQAAKSLLQVDSSNQIAINVLFKLVKNLGQSPKHPDDAQYIADGAARILSQIDPSNQLVINALVELIRTAQDHSYLNLAVKDLGHFGAGNEAAIATLIELIASTKDDYLLCDAVASLGKIDPGNEIAIPALLERIQTSQDECFLRGAAFYLGELDPGNKMALSTLSQILETTQDELERLDTAEKLVKIDPGNPKVIATLCQIRESNPYQHELILMDAVQNLEQLDLENKLVKQKLNEIIPTLIRFFQIFQQDDDNKNCCNNATIRLPYESCLLDIADSLTKILQSEHLPQVVITLKDYLSKQFYRNNSYRYEAVFNIIWHSAKNLTYPDFYKAMN